MKKLVLIPALFFGAFAVKTANAQIGLHVNLHLGGLHASAVIPVVPAAQVVEEPACADDDYYYYPEVEAYYSVPEHCYYYQDGYGSWVSAAYLPGRYHDFNWRTARRVEIRSARPYAHHDMYRSRYGGWSNRDDYYSRAFPGRDRDMPSPGFDRNDRRDWNGSRDNGRDWNHGNRNNYNHGNRDNNAYSNPGRNEGDYNQPDQNHGPQNGYGQGWGGRQNQNQGGYNQPDQNRGQQGGFGQGQNRGQYGQGQQDGGQNRGGQSQDQNQGRGRGGFGGGQYTQRGMGVVNGDRSANMAMNNRPTAGF